MNLNSAAPAAKPAQPEPAGPARLRFRDFQFQRRHVLLGAALSLGLLLAGLLLGLVLVQAFGRRRVEDAAFLNQDVHWQHTCEPRCSGK